MTASNRPVWMANLAAPAQPERNRLILALKATTSLSFAEIGARVRCSRNAVAGVVDRARRQGRLPADATPSPRTTATPSPGAPARPRQLARGDQTPAPGQRSAEARR